MRLRSVALIATLVIAVVAVGIGIISWNESRTRSPNATGVGPRASESAVSIDYPADSAPLGVPLSAWEASWAAAPAGLPPFELVDRDDDIDFLASETQVGLSAAVDLGVRGGEVEVAQLAVENGAGDEDDELIAEDLVPAFLDAAGGPTGLAAALGLEDAEDLFEDQPREVTVTDGGVTAYLAANRFGFVLGVVGDG